MASMASTDTAGTTDQLADLRTAIAATLAAVLAITDGRVRFRAAADLGAMLADTAVQVAEIKSAAALQVAEDETLSLAHLADRLSVSKTHADRLRRRGIEIRGKDATDGE